MFFFVSLLDLGVLCNYAKYVVEHLISSPDGNGILVVPGFGTTRYSGQQEIAPKKYKLI